MVSKFLLLLIVAITITQTTFVESADESSSFILYKSTREINRILQKNPNLSNLKGKISHSGLPSATWYVTNISVSQLSISFGDSSAIVGEGGVVAIVIGGSAKVACTVGVSILKQEISSRLQATASGIRINLFGTLDKDGNLKFSNSSNVSIRRIKITIANSAIDPTIRDLIESAIEKELLTTLNRKLQNIASSLSKIVSNYNKNSLLRRALKAINKELASNPKYSDLNGPIKLPWPLPNGKWELSKIEIGSLDFSLDKSSVILENGGVIKVNIQGGKIVATCHARVSYKIGFSIFKKTIALHADVRAVASGINIQLHGKFIDYLRQIKFDNSSSVKIGGLQLHLSHSGLGGVIEGLIEKILEPIIKRILREKLNEIVKKLPAVTIPI